MAIQVTIDSITGQSPYDIYICQTGGTGCFYMTTISSVPYSFDIPAPYNTSDAYMLKIIDSIGCVITGEEPVVTCSFVTPTVTPTSTVTPTVTPTTTTTQTIGVTPTSTSTPTNTSTPTVTQTPTSTIGSSPQPTSTPTSTPTVTQTSTPTNTSTQTPTNTETPTTTPTSTPTLTPSSTTAVGSLFEMVLFESGSDVIMSGTGTFNTTALTFTFNGSFQGIVRASNSLLRAGAGSSVVASDVYSGIVVYPSNFGSGGQFNANTGSGNPMGVLPFGPGDYRLLVPTGYVSNTTLTAQSTFTGQTLSSLGCTVGTYTYSWGSGANTGTLTLEVIGTSTTPTPTTTQTPTVTPTTTETPTVTPTITSTPAPTAISYVGYLADEYECGYDIGGVATGCTLINSSIDVRFPTSISPSLNRYYAPTPGTCSTQNVYFIVGNSLNNTGVIINGTNAWTTCTDACQEQCPL